MKAYTFRSGKLFKGMALTSDVKLGQIVLLGESGRGRWCERVGLDRKCPPLVIDGVVTEAIAKKITLPAKDGRAEISFWVLAKPEGDGESALVRINTEGTYTKDTSGSWKFVAGEPEELISGFGAYGDAGRIGSWKDGLVVVHPGDVLKVTLTGGSKFEPFALWMDESGLLQSATWREYEVLSAVVTAEAGTEASGQKTLFGQMSAFTWSRGFIQPGIQVKSGLAGQAIQLGEVGRGRTPVEIPLVGITVQGTLTEAAVAILKEETRPARYRGQEPEKKTFYGFTKGAEQENGFLVRIDTSWVYTRGSRAEIAPWQGTPTILCEGRGAQGDAGGIYSWPDAIAILHEGDVVYVRPEGGRKTKAYALLVKNGQLLTQEWVDWKIQDAKRDPGFYVAKGTAPWGYVPAEWIGKIVAVLKLEKYSDELYLEEKEVGEVVSIKPLALNLGWDGRDQSLVEILSGTWVRLETDKQVRRLEGAIADERTSVRARAAELLAKLEEAQALTYFGYARVDFTRQLEEARYFDTMETNSIEWWIKFAGEELAKFEAKRDEAIELERRVKASEVLFDFSAWHRRGGMSRLGDGWVIRPDGTRRESDRNSIARHKSDGMLFWNLVEADELALTWGGDLTGEVAKLPVGGCTPEQLATVEAIEKELRLSPNAFGLHPEIGGEQAKLVMAIESALARSRSLAKVPEIDFHEVTSPDGLAIAVASVRVPPGATKAMVHGRQGDLVETIPVAGGVVQIISFFKYGRDNLAIRWLSPFDAAVFAALATSEILTCIPQISEEVLRGHRGFLADNSSYLYPEGSLETAIEPQKGFKQSVRSWNDEDVPAQTLERFGGNGGILQILAWDPKRPCLCIRWRDIPAK